MTFFYILCFTKVTNSGLCAWNHSTVEKPQAFGVQGVSGGSNHSFILWDFEQINISLLLQFPHQYSRMSYPQEGCWTAWSRLCLAPGYVVGTEQTVPILSSILCPLTTTNYSQLPRYATYFQSSIPVCLLLPRPGMSFSKSQPIRTLLIFQCLDQTPPWRLSPSSPGPQHPTIHLIYVLPRCLNNWLLSTHEKITSCSSICISHQTPYSLSTNI
jgi:hypothetical protein